MGFLSLLLWGAAILIVAFILFAIYQNVTHSAYFKKNKMPYLGSGWHRLWQLLTKEGFIVEIEKEIYQESKPLGPVVGFSDFFSSKGCNIIDLEMVRNVMVKDFDHFVNRRSVQTQEANLYFKKMLFAVEGDQWKGIRNKLSPTFTTGKIRKMFPIFLRSSENMTTYVQRHVGQVGGDFNFATAFPKYAMDVIASCAFGVDSKCFDTSLQSGQMSTFEEMGKRFQFTLKPFDIVKFMLMFVAPKIADYFKLEVMDPVPQNYFASVIRDVMKRRKETGERQEDFLQLMMDVQQGIVKEDDDTNEVMYGTTEKSLLSEMSAKEKTFKMTFDDDDIIANCLLFMLGGFDTTQSLLLFAVYQFALEQEEQDKVLAEVKRVMDKDGKLTYEAVQDMTYLDMFLNETLRLYPPAARTERSCTKDYTIPGTDSVIEKGMIIGIPIYGIQRDPEYYENPDKFDPERFLPERKAARHPYSFAPFGHGPRNCIGMRFALTEVKAVLADLVYKFKFEPSQKTLIPMAFDSNSNLKPKGGMWLNVTPRK